MALHAKPMGLSANEPASRDAARRFADMPLSGLIVEWDEQLIGEERRLLTDELKARGYRLKSLPTPPDDLPDMSHPDAKQLLQHRIPPFEPLESKHAVVGALTCYAAVALILCAPAFHLGSLVLVVLYLTLGIAVHRRSRFAAFGALLLTGLQVLCVTLLLLFTGILRDPRALIWAGAGLLLLFVLLQTGAFLSRRGPRERDPIAPLE